MGVGQDEIVLYDAPRPLDLVGAEHLPGSKITRFVYRDIKLDNVFADRICLAERVDCPE
jgi:hypothetical protein